MAGPAAARMRPVIDDPDIERAVERITGELAELRRHVEAVHEQAARMSTLLDQLVLETRETNHILDRSRSSPA